MRLVGTYSRHSWWPRTRVAWSFCADIALPATNPPSCHLTVDILPDTTDPEVAGGCDREGAESDNLRAWILEIG